MPNRTPLVLYVDDDPGLARLVQKTMERRGYRFEHVTDREAGLARVAAGDVDVVVLDHYLPSGTGLDVLAAMADLVERPVVVYVTGSLETDVAIAALKAGATDYVLKTVGDDFLELLGKAIDQAVDTLRLSREKALAEREMRDARERAEIMLGEVNHRVANSLAMVAALVGLQANAIENEEAKQALAETQVRIQAIAGVHRHLYSSDDVRFVQLGDYLQNLVAELQTTVQAEQTSARISVEVENFPFPTAKAASVGVAVGELITNALKYAYGDQQPGEIRVKIAREGDLAILRVEDDGVGYGGTGAPKGTGLGSRIVKAMAHTLAGQVAYEKAGVDGGTHVVLSFPAVV